MRNSFSLFMFTFLLIAGTILHAAEPPKKRNLKQRVLPQPTRKIVYKTIGDVKLTLHLFEPEGLKPDDKRPAIVFFFGGGWVGGTPRQFYPHCADLASRGMVAFSAEYRIKSKHGTSPFECVSDGKSAVRWIRQNAGRLGIDPNRIVSGGGSAGGHVAACTGTVKKLDEPKEDLTISSCPNAMVLFNPVANTGPKGYGYKIFGERYKDISPVHNITSDIPPTIIFHGEADTVVDIATVKEFEALMKKAGNRCELVSYPGKNHGFFNYGRDKDSYRSTTQKMFAFLASLGYLKSESK